MEQSAGRPSVVLVDPQPLWLEAMEHVAERAGFRVIAKLSNSAAALALISELKPDLLVTELAMPEGQLDGVALIERARAEHRELKVVVLSSSPDPREVDAAMSAGCDAHVSKTAQVIDVISAFREVFKHSVHVEAGPATAPRAASGDAGVAARLTPRELEILRLAAEGRSNAQLARLLWVTEQTVKFHLTNVYRKLRVANRTEASRWAQVNGLLPTSDLDRAA